MIRRILLTGLLFGFLHAHARADETFHLIVMDPLSKPLSCDCVKGYAQRKYELLGEHLSKHLSRKCRVTWHESLGEAVKETGGKAHLVIGKHSVVVHDAKELGRKIRPVARLTGRDGEVSQQGLIVVRQADVAKSAVDLQGYRIFFGPAEAEEKSAAPRALLLEAGVKLGGKPEVYGACSEAAVALLKLPVDERAAAVISSYAEPLLEGCGSVKKGDLRILARTDDVPFITAFVAVDMNTKLQAQVEEALLYVSTEPKLLSGLETVAGFDLWEESAAVKKKSLANLND